MDIVEISKNNSQDIDKLIDLLDQQMHDIDAAKDKSEIRHTVKNALKPESRALFFLAKERNSPVGAAFVNIGSGIQSGGDYIWINEIQILPQHRGRGYGSKLLNHVLEWASKNSMQSVISVTDIDNSASQALFRSAGFEMENIKWINKKI
jgi:GNAT superfamily N-acetyltransferase